MQRVRRALTAVCLMALLLAGCGGGTSGRGASTAQSTNAQGVLHPPVRKFPAGENPRNVVVSVGKLWVADSGGPLREFDLRGHQLRTVNVRARSIAAGPSGLWVGEFSPTNTGPSGRLAEVDVRSGQVMRTLTTKDEADVLAVSHGVVWTASHFKSRITRIDLASGAQRVSSLPGTPSAVAIGSSAVWVALGHAGTAQAAGEPETDGGGVVGLHPVSGRQLSDQRLTAAPLALVVSPKTVWAAVAEDLDVVERLDAATGHSLSRPVPVGKQPTDLVSGDGSIWALNYSDATITRIDPSTARVTATIAFAAPTDPQRLAAGTPIRLAVTTGLLWVTDAAANTLSRLASK